MSSIDVRVRKATNAHYFSVFDGVTPLVSGEVKGGEVVYNAPVPDDVAGDLTVAVKAACAKVDAEVGPILARNARKRALAREAAEKAKAAAAKTDPAPADEEAPKTKAAPKKGGRS